MNTIKTLGILGGVGPGTTAKIYLSIVESFRKKAKNYPSIIIWNLPFPFAIEKEVIVKGINSQKMLPYLIDGAQILEKAGATFGILPCNTLHKYLEDIRKSVNIPFLSILDESAAYLDSLNIKKVGILATKTTVTDRLYDGALKIRGIETFYPDKKEQEALDRTIIQLIEEKTKGNYNDAIAHACKALKKKGAQAILLACTDLQLSGSHINIKIPIIDTTAILINASVRELNKVK